MVALFDILHILLSAEIAGQTGAVWCFGVTPCLNKMSVPLSSAQVQPFVFCCAHLDTPYRVLLAFQAPAEEALVSG